MGVLGLSPARAQGQSVPKKMVKNEVLPHAFSILLYIIYELLGSAQKPSPRGQILETALGNTQVLPI